MSEKAQKNSWFKGLNKAVVSVSVTVGVIIALIDFLIQNGIDILVNLG